MSDTPIQYVPPQEEGMYKVVKVNGEWRFVPSTAFSGEHKDAVGEGEKPLVEAAGTLNITPGIRFKLLDSLSVTLGAGMGDTEISELEELLGIPFEE